MEDDGDDKDDSKRRTRNLSEKKRRDQFNTLVNELSVMVSASGRKMDKSTVLKSTITFLRSHNEKTYRSRVHDVHEDWKPSFLSNEEFTYLVLEALEGFVLIFSSNGRILYVSESITSLLGYSPADVINRTIYDFTVDDDKQNLYTLLQNRGLAASSDSASIDSEIRFQCHFRRRTLDYTDDSMYELIQFIGHLRPSTELLSRHETPSHYQDNESGVLFVCTGRLYTPQLIRDASLVDSGRNEFTSRHSLEWKFLYLDHRAPPIIGYLPFEVLGTSGYDYYHFDDLDKVVNCHEALMQKGELTSCYYRFLTKGQQWIWLQTRFYITYHQWNSKPEFVVCTNHVVSYADISKKMKQEPDTPESSARQKPRFTQEEITANSPSMDHSYRNHYEASISQAPSVKSSSADSTTSTTVTKATAATSWPRDSQSNYGPRTETTTFSSESRSSRRPRIQPEMQKWPLTGLVPQHSIGSQYLSPTPYTGTLTPMVPAMLPIPLPTLPVLVPADQAQCSMQTELLEPADTVAFQHDASQWPWQEQLQRKHEELQQMILSQQEELRQVKEQLLLARLGILQPLLNSPFSEEDAQDQMTRPNQSQRLQYPQQRPPNGSGPHHHHHQHQQ